MAHEEFGEDVFLDDDTKLLNKIRKKKSKPSIDLLNRADLTERDMDELFAEV